MEEEKEVEVEARKQAKLIRIELERKIQQLKKDHDEDLVDDVLDRRFRR